MRGDYWLPPAQQAQLLRNGMRLTAALTVLWGLTTGYLWWGASRELAGEKAEIAARRKHLTEIATEVGRRKAERKAKDSLRSEAPNGMGSSLFAGEISQLATYNRLLLQNFRYGAPKVKAPPENAIPPPQGATPAPGATGDAKPTPAPGSEKTENPDGMEPMTYELNGTGDFPALMTFLEQLTELPRVVEIHSLQLTRSGLEPGADRAVLTFHISGAFYGLSEKQ